ncbi:MAG TPA: tetratricopeptide repeat protein [Kofleriaceae bacterium]|jgi:thioredoxin-like negative regulator of GroEL|nr:tetratricopeptide repeat protein [Kofleriaceae bacterium]
MSSVARRYYERGRAALDTNDLESAQEALRAALDLAPSFGNARVAYSVALAKAGDAPRAASVLRAGLGRASSPISAAAMHATLGDILTLGGDFFGAEEAFQTARATPGFEVRAAAGLARVYARLGRFRDMAAQLKLAAQASAAAAPATR